MRTIGIIDDKKKKKPNSGEGHKTGDKPEGTGATENVAELESAEKE